MITLELPVPPTVNHAYAVVRGRKILSKAGRDYKAEVIRLVHRAQWQALAGEVEWSLYWWRAIRSGDLTNRIKLVEDALKGLAWRDDADVVAFHAYRGDDKDRPGITIQVQPGRSLPKRDIWTPYAEDRAA